MKKPRCPWQAPFYTRVDGEFSYLEYANGQDDPLMIKSNDQDDINELLAFCYALNKVYGENKKKKECKTCGCSIDKYGWCGCG